MDVGHILSVVALVGVGVEISAIALAIVRRLDNVIELQIKTVLLLRLLVKDDTLENGVLMRTGEILKPRNGAASATAPRA